MAKKDKGSGARKYGRNERKCAAYSTREASTRTPKTRKLLKLLTRWPDYEAPGWQLNEAGNKVYKVK
jgi:hypothetical protein